MMRSGETLAPSAPQLAAVRAKSALSKAASGERSIHPALIPGIDVENTDADFKTNKPVFAIALAAAIAVLVWAMVAPENLSTVGGDMRSSFCSPSA